MTAPAVASLTTGQGNFVTTVTCSKPSGLAAGDLLVFFGIARDASATAEYSLSGWTGPNPAGSTTGTRTTPLWRVADSTDAAASSFVFTASGTVETAGGVLVRVTGGPSSSAFTANVELMQTTSVAFDPPASGTVASGDYLCLTSLSFENDLAITPPTNYAEEVELLLNYARDATLGVGSRQLTGITSEDPGAWGGTSLPSHTWTILIPSGVTMQTVLPDADITTTGWTAIPLFSKVDDDPASPDGTTITATAT